MTSLKAKTIIWLMRNRHILHGKFTKPVQGADRGSVLAFRETCEKGAERFGKIDDAVVVKEEVINMVLSEWLIPDGAPENRLIFYVHGGGYVSGSCNDHRSIVSKIASQTGMKTLLYEYGLAPENPFPAALNDSISVYQAVIEKGYKAGNIIIMGESAGGGLCLALLLAIKDKNMPLPAASVAISPWTDLSCSSDSYRTRNRVSLAPLDSWTVFSAHYVNNHDVNDPYISPLFGELAGLPPLHINVGMDDELYEDGKKFSERAKSAGVEVEYIEGKGMVHCYPLLAPMFSEASKAMKAIVDFIHRNLNS